MVPKVAAKVKIEDHFDAPFSDLGSLVSTLLPNVYVFAGLIFFLIIIGGGLSVILANGQGQKENLAKGKKILTAALIGFLVIIGSYWIIQIIQTIVGVKFLDPQTLIS